MSNLIARLKQLRYETCAFNGHNFPYFGAKVFFEKGDIVAYRAWKEGIYECDIINLLIKFMDKDSYYIDVGANIGLMALPALSLLPSIKCVSIEPSPNTFRLLERTAQNSPYADRWITRNCALWSQETNLDFHVSEKNHAAFDSVTATGRTAVSNVQTVKATTLDHEWKKLDRPKISVIKIDVEGAELEVLKGGKELLEKEKPILCFEAESQNLKAFGLLPQDLWTWADTNAYQLFTVPSLAHIGRKEHVAIQIKGSEMLLAVPV
ncbi:FkbM family methyltransferase [Rubellicoccus peritrichatus]|uniref:FkbM family methyltransferase n=1 Tax=Rubellicoccus peritrichatus TaxID=3080537 RepID=A0AAQ3QVH7_9BACT|nr:FkbM family methyltransferase [Puniceicoccus sp. CR14]WOO40817.1 FkbM family methyltransferase [Puniceicoccus sp. CR14]